MILLMCSMSFLIIFNDTPLVINNFHPLYFPIKCISVFSLWKLSILSNLHPNLDYQVWLPKLWVWVIHLYKSSFSSELNDWSISFPDGFIQVSSVWLNYYCQSSAEIFCSNDYLVTIITQCTRNVIFMKHLYWFSTILHTSKLDFKWLCFIKYSSWDLTAEGRKRFICFFHFLKRVTWINQNHYKVNPY